jgi:hypothetical protein
MQDKDLRQIWAQLARALRVQEIPEPIRDELLREYKADIDVAIGTGDPEDLELLVKKARGFYRVYLSPRNRKGKPNKETLDETSQETTPEVGQYESLRAVVLSEYLAKIASTDPTVDQFRNDILGGELLTPEPARAFLSSPATRYLGRGIWRTNGIPAKHTATLLDENYGHTEDGPFHWVQVRTDPLGETHAVFIPNPQSYDHLTYLAENGRPERVTFWRGSVLGDLHKLCKELVKAHPWDIDEATWFVLTGEMPLVRPIRAKTTSSFVPDGRAYNSISLVIQPWVSPETVEVAYRQLQKRVIGGDYGRISDKNLNLLRFVAGQVDDAGNLPKGEVLVKAWDKKWKNERPEWCYGADTRRFWRDFRSVQESVTNSRRAGIILEPGKYTPDEMVPS